MMNVKSITLKQIRALAAIQKAGSLTAAAEVLNLTVPAVSAQLRALETNLESKMLDRGPDGRSLITQEGHEVLSSAEEIEIALRRCYQRIDALRTGKTGQISLGVVSTAKYFAPGLVMQARRALPGLNIDLKIGNRDEIIRALERNEFDLTIMGRPPRLPAVSAHRLGDHPHIIIAPPNHPFTKYTEVKPEALLSETFLTRELGSGTRILMERFLDRIGEGSPYKIYELGTNETIKQAVIAGLGIALISAHTVTAELESGRIVSIKTKGLPLIRQWFVSHRTDRKLNPAANQVRDFFIGLSGSFLPKPSNLG